MAASGHVFIVRGDLLQLACDAVAIPTDEAGVIEAAWRSHVASLEGVEFDGHRVRGTSGSGREALVDGPYWPGQDAGPGTPATWLVQTGVLPRSGELGPDDPSWEQALAHLREVLLELARAVESTKLPDSGRGCHLVAMPLLGKGAGGFKRHFRPYAARLLRAVHEAATVGGFDVALVVYGGAQRAEAYEALCRRERSAAGLLPPVDELAARWVLGARPTGATEGDAASAAVQRLRLLVDKARAGDLIPFFGAGVSRSGGAVGWDELIATLEDRAGLGDLSTSGLDLLARAQIVENSIGAERLQEELASLLGRARVSLQHLLLAGLGARDAVTTNFDDAYERAVADAGRGEVAVVPQPSTSLRLLKLHGTVSPVSGPSGMAPPAASDGPVRPSAPPALAPVLTRDQFLEHAGQSGPLRGALQMMLLTGHVMFVGYSLNDPDLHAAIHEVRRIRELAAIASDEPLATALQVVPSPELGYLWAPTVSVLWPSPTRERPEDAAASFQPRELELLLDVIADAANSSELPVLAFEPHELDEHELRLAERLRELRGLFDGQNTPPAVRSLLAAYGFEAGAG